MAYGGGTFLTQNKILGGAYINFVSKAVASATLKDRGIVAMGFTLDWGKDGEIFEVVEEDVIKNSLELFGYDYSSDKLRGLKDIFLNATKLYAYKLNTGGAKASNDYATAKYTGTCGNSLKVVISVNIDESSKYDVALYYGNKQVDLQTVSNAGELVNNAWVDWNGGANLTVTAGTALSGGSNGTVSASEHQDFINKLESFPDVNAVGYAGEESTIKALYVAWVKNQRDKVGVKLQAVVHNYPTADSEAVVNVKNEVTNGDTKADLVYFATGIIAGTAVNKSATNKLYNGNFTVKADYTQSQLEKAILAGEWTLHKTGNEIRVLEDINSLVTVTPDKGEIFKDNQTIRIIDQIAMAVANIFCTKYLGNVPNDKDGRLSLWGDICKIHTDLQDIRALEDFKNEDITVSQGDTKKAVVVNESITVVNTMVRLYMTVIVG